MKLKMLVTAISQMMGWQPGHVPTKYMERAQKVAPLVLKHTELKSTDKKDDKLDPVLVAAVILKESSMREMAVGKAGEIGYGQIKPDGVARKICPGLDIEDPDDNIACTVKILKMAKRICGGDPLNWLGVYQGQRECGPSLYAERVLGLTARASKLELALR